MKFKVFGGNGKSVIERRAIPPGRFAGIWRWNHGLESRARIAGPNRGAESWGLTR
jgi:hypothetical protein